jgi:hypothetical protein
LAILLYGALFFTVALLLWVRKDVASHVVEVPQPKEGFKHRTRKTQAV